MKLTFKQIQSLLDVVKAKHSQFIMVNLGPNFLTSADITLLKAFGITPRIFRGQFSYLDYAFYFGLLSEALGNKKAKNMTFSQLKKFISSNKFVPLTETELATLDFVKTRSYNDISNLSKSVQSKVNNLLTNRSLRLYWNDLLKEKSSEAIENRETQKWLASQLANITEDWGRDFDRIANYIMHEAFDFGRAQYILNHYGADAEVYKDVYKGACPHCIRLYMTDGYESEPQIFKLSDLYANGNNIGRKAVDYLPVIGSTHPWCRCTLAHKPENTEWNSETRAFDIYTRNTYGVKRKTKIKVTITN